MHVYGNNNFGDSIVFNASQNSYDSINISKLKAYLRQVSLSLNPFIINVVMETKIVSSIKK